jgi:hypothetical protein
MSQQTLTPEVGAATDGQQQPRRSTQLVPAPQPARSVWTGWIGFAGVMMMLGGTINAFYGIVALVNDQWVVWANRGAMYFDLTTWGWILLGSGIVVFLAGLGVMTGNVAARAIGVLIASLSLIANFFFIPAYPFWALSVMAIDAVVIWALTAHGHDVR